MLARRKEQAQVFFNQVAGRFDRVYGPGRSWQAFGHLLLRILPPLVVADLGAGEGLLSELLARRCKKVIAVDNSEKIVAFGAAKAKKNGLKNLEFRQGDLQNPPIEASSVDLVILSQALHHAEIPADAIAAAHKILRPARADFDSRFAQAQLRQGAANFTATAGWVLPKAICTAGSKPPVSRKSKSASSPPRNSRRISRPFWLGRKKRSGDAPVAGFKFTPARNEALPTPFRRRGVAATIQPTIKFTIFFGTMMTFLIVLPAVNGLDFFRRLRRGFNRRAVGIHRHLDDIAQLAVHLHGNFNFAFDEQRRVKLRPRRVRQTWMLNVES